MHITKILTPPVRRWMYGMAIAFVPVAVYLGWLEPEAAPIVVPLIVAVFNVKDDAPPLPPIEIHERGVG